MLPANTQVTQGQSKICNRKKKLQGEEDFSQAYYNRGEKSELNLRTIYPTEKKGRKVFKGWNEPVEKLLENTTRKFGQEDVLSILNYS